MELEQPEHGDVILQPELSSPHSILWVGPDERCMAEASAGRAYGLRLAKRTAFKLPEYPEEVTVNRVYGCKSKDIARKAAEYAVNWATTVDRPSHLRPGTTYAQIIDGNERAVLPTPYQRRARKEATSWSPTVGLFSAVRAWARAVAGNPLSFNQGMGCAAFVTYCYQVASLQVKFGEQLVKERLDFMMNFVVLKNAANVAWAAKWQEVVGAKQGAKAAGQAATDSDFLLDPRRKEMPEYRKAQEAKRAAVEQFEKLGRAAEEMTGAIAKEVMLDAKTSTTEKLLEQFKNGEHFTFRGYLVGDGDPKENTKKVGIVLEKDKPSGQRDFADYQKALKTAFEKVR